MRRKQTGFSLIELLVVVAIILTIAAIAIPQLLRARIAANESAAVATLKTLNTAETSYIVAYPTCGYVDLPNLGGNGSGPTAAGILDNVFPDRSGYHFAISLSGAGGGCGVTSGATYNIQASPFGTTMTEKYFYTDPSSVVHFNPASPAGPSDPVI